MLQKLYSLLCLICKILSLNVVSSETQSFLRSYGCCAGLEDVFGPITGSSSFLKANWVIGFIYKKERKKERKRPLTVEGFQVSFSTFNMNLAHFSSHGNSELFDQANSDMPQTQKIIFSEDLILSTCSDASEHSEYTDCQQALVCSF